MAIRGFIVHDRESGAYALTDSERRDAAVILKNAVAPESGSEHAANGCKPCQLGRSESQISGAFRDYML